MPGDILMARRPAFTLSELLVAVAVIAIRVPQHAAVERRLP
jgi:prepilin-type N-terminal cleavage/methylation domain-containing protein